MSQFVGAVLRAVAMIVIVAMPAVMLPGSHDSDYFAALACLAVGCLVMAEYTATYPGLIEFRDAPPYNRFRAITAFAVLFLLTVVGVHAQGAESTLAILLRAVGHSVGAALDFSFSPVRLMLLTVADGEARVAEVLTPMLGLAAVVGVAAVGLFAALMRATGWPLGRGRLNLWTNLPLFDPVAGEDVAERLRKSAAVNYSFAFLSPFLVPLGIEVGGEIVGTHSGADMQVMVWTVAIWVLAPVCFAMRAMALGKIVGMIEAQRRAAAPTATPA